MRVSVDDNPNCELPDDRIFQERSASLAVTHVLRVRGGKEVWCPVVALDKNGAAQAAMACKVDDSGDGTCYLVVGGRWGLRLKDPECRDPWDVKDPHQWGEAFLLLPADGADLRFAA